MNFLKYCCVRGQPDASLRPRCLQVLKHHDEHVYQSPKYDTSDQVAETVGESWWPADLKRLFDNADDEFYLGRLTFLCLRAQQRTGYLAMEDVDAHTLRAWKWVTPLHSDHVASCIVDTTTHKITPESEECFDIFVSRYVNEFFEQRSCNDARFREKCVNGRYVSSPELCEYDDIETE